jgi:hypothetical protein
MPERSHKGTEKPVNLLNAILADDLATDATLDIDVWPESIPLRERLLDRMGDLLLCAEDLLEMLAVEDNRYRFPECEGPLRTAYTTINQLMQTLCD